MKDYIDIIKCKNAENIKENERLKEISKRIREFVKECDIKSITATSIIKEK